MISDRADYEFAGRSWRGTTWRARVAAILFSPVHGVLAPRRPRRAGSSPTACRSLQLQVHKYIWEPGTRGVYRARTLASGR